MLVGGEGSPELRLTHGVGDRMASVLGRGGVCEGPWCLRTHREPVIRVENTGYDRAAEGQGQDKIAS